MQKFVYILIKQSCWEGISFERGKPVWLQVHKHLTNIDYTRLSAMLHSGTAVRFHTLSTSTSRSPDEAPRRKLKPGSYVFQLAGDKPDRSPTRVAGIANLNNCHVSLTILFAAELGEVRCFCAIKVLSVP